MKVTITASLQPIPNTLNLYGEHNLNRDLLKLVESYSIGNITVHIYRKEGAIRAAEFCARNNVQYKII